MRHVIVAHAHHADEGVYRLTHGPAEFVEVLVEVENEDFDPSKPEAYWPTKRIRNPQFDELKKIRAEHEELVARRVQERKDAQKRILDGEMVDNVLPPEFEPPELPDVPEYIEVHDHDKPVVHNTRTKWVTRTEDRVLHAEDVVWDDRDERWQGMSRQEIAETQVREVKAALRDREKAAEAQAERVVEHFDTAGQAL